MRFRCSNDAQDHVRHAGKVHVQRVTLETFIDAFAIPEQFLAAPIAVA